jgi:hypothetical protein
MKKNLPTFPELSPAFTLDDIRKIRDYNYELSKVLSEKEMDEYYHEAADNFKREMAERRAKGLKPIRPKRIAV